MSTSTSTGGGKVDIQHFERRTGSGVEDLDAHQQYVLARHGRLDLMPVPSADPHDPLNWPAWKKNTLLVLVSFHAMMAISAASAVIPAFFLFVEDFGITITQASYLVSVQIIFIGLAPFIWTPIADRYGRRPVFLVSTLVSAIVALCGAFCKTYGTLVLTRCIQATFLATAVAIGAGTVAEMFFAHERGRKMGVWTLLVTIGAPIAPLTTAYMVQDKGWHWIFYLLAIINLAQFFAYLVFCPETLYIRAPVGTNYVEPAQKVSTFDQYFRIRRINPKPFNFIDFIRPFRNGLRLCVLLPALAYAITFTYTGVVFTVLVPQVFGEKFHLNEGQIGLQFISLVVGAIIGEQLAGPFSDWVVKYRSRTRTRTPEMRLIAAYPGFAAAIAGIVAWGVTLDQAAPGHWTIKPDIASAVAMGGLQIVTTVCTTYAVECYRDEAPQVSAFLTFTRQLYAFIAPFYFTPAIENMGVAGMAGLFGGLTGLAAVMVLACDIMGVRWRSGEARDERELRGVEMEMRRVEGDPEATEEKGPQV
ncbi:MFS general substrate transporter [Saitoella complicata NRRL Y-17804]|uniref:Major facilitator superfamily (MFS) profile domain-containing protein n=1 Tax=Saitoella complicata (strain BCRC 22490 / CBS 7301 / JCM 7358 / NBRC 10748 / NRRL Y-17804) TaxID=698492 RepID=A0A0E9NMZ2_SAICN|nr:MFS general substrate transporter [Saitoella complicata NRRL Y-17804]ODQ55415.1 MFS general substrate transporter [Saitoella complicata NRRL Y-17804]GAO51204.1 hypothetical protein G7K_5315-t1 [Saitoella complicata NRRL Y-17804]